MVMGQLDARAAVRDLWRGRAPDEAQEAFFAALWASRGGRDRPKPRDGEAAVRDVEVQMRAGGAARTADAIDACLVYLRHAPDANGAMPALLRLLAGLARPERTQDEAPVELSPVVDKLMAAACVVRRDNTLHGVSDFASRASAETLMSQLVAPGHGNGRRTATVPLRPAALVRATGEVLQPERFEYALLPRATPARPSSCGDEGWVSEMLAQAPDFGTLASFGAVADERALEDLSPLTEMPPVPVPEDPEQLLLGGLHSGSCGGGANAARLDVRLSLPDLVKQYRGLAPDPMGQLVERKDKTAAAAATSRPPRRARRTLAPAPAAGRPSVEAGPDKWVLAGRESGPGNAYFGWEEQVAESHVCVRGTSALLQYAHHGLLVSERGDAAFQELVQDQGHLQGQERDLAELVHDCLFALLGVASATFQADKGLLLNPPGTRVAGLSAEAVGAALQPVRRCGNLYLRLLGVAGDRSPLASLFIGEPLRAELRRFLAAYEREQSKVVREQQGRLSLVRLGTDASRLAEMLSPVMQAVHECPASSLALLELLHRRVACGQLGADKAPAGRVLLERGLGVMQDVLAKWLLTAREPAAEQAFLRCNLRHPVPSTAWIAVSLGQRADSVWLELPSFVRSDIGSVGVAEVAECAVKAGSLLRILAGLEGAEDLVAICIDATQSAFPLDLQTGAMSAAQVHGALVAATRRFEGATKRLRVAVIALEEARQQSKRALVQEAVRKAAEAQGRAQALVAKLEAFQASEEAAREESRLELLEGFRKAADEAREAKRQTKLAEQLEERLRIKGERDATSLVSDADRARAEAYLLNQFEALTEGHRLRMETLTAEERVSLASLETAVADLKTMRTRPVRVHTSVNVSNLPGGDGAAMREALGGAHRTQIAPSTSVRIAQAPGGNSAMSTWDKQTDDTPAHVKVMQEPGGTTTIGSLIEGRGDDDETPAHVKIMQTPGGTSTIGSLIEGGDVEDTTPAHVKIMQAPGGTSTMDTWNEQADDTPAHVKIMQTPGGTSTIGSLIEGGNGEKDTTPAHVKIMQAPGGTSTMDTWNEQLDDTPAHVKIMQTPGGTSTIGSLIEGGNGEKDTTPAHVKIMQAPGGTSTMDTWNEQADDTPAHVKIMQSPGGTSTIGSLIEGGNDEKDTTPAHVKIMQAPGGTSTMDTWNEQADDTPAHVKIMQSPGGTSTIGSLIEGGNDEKDTTPAHVKIMQAPGGTSTMDTWNEQLDDTPAHVKVMQTPGGTSTIGSLIEGGNDEKDTTPTHVKVMQAPGGTSTMDTWNEQADETPAHVKIMQSPGGTSTIGSLIEGGNGEKDTTPAHVKIMQAPGGTSTMDTWNEQSDDTPAHVKIMQTPGGTSTIGSLIEGGNDEKDTTPTHVKVTQSPGGTSPAGGELRNELAHGARKSSVQTSPLANDSSSMRRLLEQTPRLGSERKLIAASSARRALPEVSAQPLGHIMSSLHDCCAAPAVQSAGDDDLDDASDDASGRALAPLALVVEQGIVQPLLLQCRLINSAAAAALCKLAGVEEQLDTVRQQLLMARGDLFVLVVRELAKIRSEDDPVCLRNGAALRRRLDIEALALDELLPAPDIKLHYSLVEPRSDAPFETLEWLKAGFGLDWPLTMVLSEEELAHYGAMHRFLLRVKLTSALCKDMWAQLGKRNRKWRGGGRDRRLLWLQLCWQRIRHVFAALESNVLAQVLNDHWVQLRAGMQWHPGQSPAALRRAHAQFCHNALRACFLDPSRASQTVQGCLGRLIAAAFRLHAETTAALDELETDRARATLGAAWEEFKRTESFLSKMLASVPPTAAGTAGPFAALLSSLLT